MSTQINFAKFIDVSFVNGPGRRAVIWVQGCPFRCEGCWNPDFWEFIPKNLVSPVALTKAILNIPKLEGVTFSGGEPFAQAANLAKLGAILKKQGLSIITYTGYTLEALKKAVSREWLDLLKVTDVLIDGPFVLEQKENLPLRGSRNQRILFLTDRYKSHPFFTEKVFRASEVHVSSDHSIQLTGFPEFNLEDFVAKLRKHGIYLQKNSQ